MNARELALPVIPEFLLGDQLLHARFSLAIELLLRIVIANPRPVTTSVLAAAVAQPPRTVRALLANLHQSGLLCQDEKNKDAWSCAAALSTITLADVFRSVAGAMHESASRKKKDDATLDDESRSAAQQSVDLLLMQATMAINQVVLQHLQTFDLGRLKALASSSASYPFHSRPRSYVAEPV
ncbi:MAG: Rrf2 family transcriptional regulator [Noviherbaspirillum sp.]